MKKWIVLTMALIFALGLTSVVIAADEKLPADTKKETTKVKSLPPGAGPEEKANLDDAKKKATVKGGAAKETAVPGLGPEEKQQKEDLKKKATVKKKAKKPGGPAATPGIGPEEKGQLEDLKKPSTADKMKEKKEAAPAEKK